MAVIHHDQHLSGALKLRTMQEGSNISWMQDADHASLAVLEQLLQYSSPCHTKALIMVLSSASISDQSKSRCTGLQYTDLQGCSRDITWNLQQVCIVRGTIESVCHE